MSDILDKEIDPKTAAITWLKANPDALKKWLDGVATFDNSRNAFDAIQNTQDL